MFVLAHYYKSHVEPKAYDNLQWHTMAGVLHMNSDTMI